MVHIDVYLLAPWQRSHAEAAEQRKPGRYARWGSIAWVSGGSAADRSALTGTVLNAGGRGELDGLPPPARRDACSSGSSNVVRLRDVGWDLEPVQRRRELPPRIHV